MASTSSTAGRKSKFDAAASTTPPPPKFSIDQIVRSSTIVPTCYFTIQSVRYDVKKQAHLYNIKSLPKIGNHCQPDIARTVPEESLELRETIHARNLTTNINGQPLAPLMVRDSSSSDQLAEITNLPNPTSTFTTIEIGDSILMRINSTGEPDKCSWVPGTVVGLSSQHGLWECFLVTVGKSEHTTPCTERLLKLVKKGTQSGKKKLVCNVVRVGGLNGLQVRTMRPIIQRTESGMQGPKRFISENGICFGDAVRLG